MHRLTTAIAFILLNCIQAATAASREYADIHTIAVISNLGSQVRVQRKPFTRLGEFEDYKLDMDWNPDALIEQQIMSMLAGHFAIKNPTVDRESFSNIKGGNENVSEIRKRIASLSQSDGIDAYLIVLPEDSIGTGGDGINIFHSPGFGDGQTILGAIYSVGIFDARTGRRIDYSAARDPLSHAIWGNGPPEEFCGAELFPEGADRVTTDQKARYVNEFQALLRRSIVPTLANAGLIDKSEVNGAVASIDMRGDATCHPPS